MRYEEYLEKLKNAVEKKLGCPIEIKEIKKNNGYTYRGLVVHDGASIKPVIAVQEYYHADMNEKEIMHIVCEIVKIYEHYNVAYDEKDASCKYEFEHFEEISDRIVYKLVSKERNLDLLKEVPYTDLAGTDLVKLYYILWEATPDGTRMTLLKNIHLQIWDVCVDQLYKLAEENTPRLLEPNIVTMRQIVECMYGKNVRYREGVDDMLILTNIFRINGAGVICYDGLLKILADMAGGNLIIIPCSIHETIVMSEKTWLDEQVLQEMVYSVNREEVPADEILSDHPFRYEREMNRLCMI